LAIRTIMAGLNQTLMLSLSMVVIAALIGAGGLGLTVYTGLGRLDVGLAALGGIGIVLLAIALDRITQSMGEISQTRGGFSQLKRLWLRLRESRKTSKTSIHSSKGPPS
jgi:glycine betaine/proline transport system permease protein